MAGARFELAVVPREELPTPELHLDTLLAM
jgi:hypothetical protein